MNCGVRNYLKKTNPHCTRVQFILKMYYESSESSMDEKVLWLNSNQTHTGHNDINKIRLNAHRVKLETINIADVTDSLYKLISRVKIIVCRTKLKSVHTLVAIHKLNISLTCSAKFLLDYVSFQGKIHISWFLLISPLIRSGVADKQLTNCTWILTQTRARHHLDEAVAE